MKRRTQRILVAVPAVLVACVACVVLYVAAGKALGPYMLWIGLAQRCGPIDATRGWLAAGRPAGFDDCLDPSCEDDMREVCDRWRTPPPAHVTGPTPPSIGTAGYPAPRTETASLDPSAPGYPPPRPAATTVPEPGRDDAGYRPAPHIAHDFEDGYDEVSIDYVPLESGPEGAFLSKLQALLDNRDAAGLARLAGIDPSAKESFQFACLADTDACPGEVPDGQLESVLRQLFEAGSRPMVQGYFGLPNAESGLPGDLGLAVVIDGWRGSPQVVEPTGIDGDVYPSFGVPDPVRDTAVWSFEVDGGGDERRWNRWHYETFDGRYDHTLDAYHSMFLSTVRWPTYEVVRLTSALPTPVASPTLELPSPDGRWTARVYEYGGMQLLDSRDPDSLRQYRAIEVADGAGKVVWRPVAAWDREGAGGPCSWLFGWRPDSAELLYHDTECGDGCGWPFEDDLQRLDIRTGAVQPANVAGADHILDPTGRRLAYVTGGTEQPRIAVTDLDTSTAVSATLAADYGERPAWSPDGRSVALTLLHDVEPCVRPARTSIARFDVDTGRLTELLAPEATYWQVAAWRADGTIELRGPTIDEKTPVQRIIDAVTGRPVP
jgi:hypothetical protein